MKTTITASIEVSRKGEKTNSRNVKIISHIEKPNVSFECDIFAQTFLQKPSLQLHMRKHANKKTAKCTVCSKEFRCYATLIIHQTVHTGEKSFPCSVCSKSFSRKSSLKSHMTALLNSNVSIATKHFNEKKL